MLAQPAVVQPQDEPEPGVEASGGEGGTDVGLVVVIDEGERAARSTPASASAASVASAVSTTRTLPAGSVAPAAPPARPTAAFTTRSSSAADAARARPTTGGRTVRSEGGTTSVTCSPYTPRNSAASRCASPSSPHTTMCATVSLPKP